MSKRNNPTRVIRFVVVFTVLVTLGSVIEVYLLRGDGGGTPRRWIAEMVGGGLRILGMPARVEGTALHLQRGTVEVAVECTGIKATAIFCAGVLAFPCSRRGRIIGLLMGLCGVAILNLLRIATLAIVAGYAEPWFDRVHALLMQGFLILFVAPLWVVWMMYAGRALPPGSDVYVAGSDEVRP